MPRQSPAKGMAPPGAPPGAQRHPAGGYPGTAQRTGGTPGTVAGQGTR